MGSQRSILAVVLLIALAGCETTKNRCWTSIKMVDGSKFTQYGMSRGTVLGGGETTSSVTGVCGQLDRNTLNTGLTDNGREALTDAVRSGVCAATGGVGCLVD